VRDHNRINNLQEGTKKRGDQDPKIGSSYPTTRLTGLSEPPKHAHVHTIIGRSYYLMKWESG